MNDIKDQIEKKAVDLAAAYQTLEESDEYIALTQEDRIKKIEKLKRDREKLDNKIAGIQMEISAADPENAALVEKTEAEVERLQKEIKTLAYSIPVENLAKKGFKVLDREENPRVTVTISKATTVSTFDTEQLLEEFPDLLSAEMDGDYVVTRSIDAAVLERMIESGDAPRDVLKYRTIAKSRNPSVRIARK